MPLQLVRLFLVAIFILPPAALLAATPRQVSYMTDAGQTVHGLLYEPAWGGRHPGIVVIHEWWGLTPWVQQQAQDLAQEGYVVLAVDLYGGRVTTNPQVARRWDMGLNQQQAIANVVAAADYLAAQKNVDARRIGAAGWCMGGGFAAQLAIHDPDLRAVAINYGELPQNPSQLKNIHAAVLGIFGGRDPVVPPEEVKAFERTMKSLGKPIEIRIYPDAGHAFENPDNRNGYRPADTASADRLMRTFFAQTLLH